MLARLANRLILGPTCDAIDTNGKTRRLVHFASGSLELWSPRPCEHPPGEAQVYILKFGGTHSRAERATEHPAEAWSDLTSEVWAVNPPGYGGSPGMATLRGMAAMADAAYADIASRAGDRPIVVTGNSLGACYALYVAARRRVNGMILRNPPPLRSMIVRRHGWWNGYLGAALIAWNVPRELDGVSNAARCSAPAVMMASLRDRVVPVRFQRDIHRAYAGEKQILELPEADHADPLNEKEMAQYAQMLHWLRRKLSPSC